MQRGDFSEWLGPQIATDALGRPAYQGEIYDPNTTRSDGHGGFIRDPFMYNGQMNVIDPSRLSSVSKAFQTGLPQPTQSGLANNWVGSYPPQPTNQFRLTTKIDHTISSNKQISLAFDNNWLFNVGNTGVAGAFAPIISQYWSYNERQPRARLNFTWTIRPNLLFNIHGGYSLRQNYIEAPGPAMSFGATAGLKGVLSPETPNVGIQNATGFGPLFRKLDSALSNYPADIYVAWSKGSHNFKFGTTFLLQGLTYVNEFGSSGTYSFNRLVTGLPGVTNTGVGYASYLTGYVQSSSLTSPSAYRRTGENWAFYAQDQWRVTPRLTLNYGLRYDLFMPYHESYNRVGCFDPTIPNPAAGGLLGALTFWGSGPGRNSRTGIYDVYTKAWGPRLGLVYALNSKTVFRAGGGIIYLPQYTSANYATNYGSAFTVTSSSLDNGVTPAFNWQNGFPPILPQIPSLNPALLNGSSVNWMNPADSKVGRTYTVDVGVEREIPGGFIIKADYIANLAHNVPTSVPYDQLNPSYISLGNLLSANINSPQAVAAGIKPPYAGFTGSVAQALRPYPQYTGVTEVWALAGFSTYNSFQLSAQKRAGHGLTFLGSYTAAKQLTNGAFQLATNRAAGKAIWGLDRSQMLTFNYLYELPFGPGKRFANTSNRALKQLVGGWKVSGIHSYVSGWPVAVSTEASIAGIGGVWANLVPGVPITTANGCGNYDPNNPAANRFLNINAFSTPAPFTLGNTSTLPSTRQCGYLNENISVLKDFPIKESVRSELGFDFFNAFNRHQWINLSTDINNPAAFGRYSGASTPRTIQVHLKLDF